MTIAHLRPAAEEDLVERTRYYRDQGGDELGERFFDTAIASLRAPERMPSIGSPRIGELCDIPGLRSYRIEGFPHRLVLLRGRRAHRRRQAPRLHPRPPAMLIDE